MPIIHSGQAGGDRDRIISIINDDLKHNNMDIIVYGKNNQPKKLTSIKNRLRCYFFYIFIF